MGTFYAILFSAGALASASWTLTSHEARPGHEMQFSACEFHDFILSQGLLPPSVLRAAAIERFAK
jgi:uncharacterized protein (DUF885 family)